MSEYFIRQLIALIFMAVALGMDAFSLSLAMGMQQLRLKRIALIGFTVGIFHILMPFIGILLGKVISEQIGGMTTIAASLLLMGIGVQMIFSAFFHEAKKLIQPFGIGLIIFAFTVSLDSFSIGLSLGITGVRTILSLILFGASSTILSWVGMLLGRKVHGFLGKYSEILGGSILLGFGIMLLLG